MDKMLDLKTLQNTDLAWTQGLTNLLCAFMTYKNRGLYMLTYKKKLWPVWARTLNFFYLAGEVCEKNSSCTIFWSHYVHSIDSFVIGFFTLKKVYYYKVIESDIYFFLNFNIKKVESIILDQYTNFFKMK